MAWTQGLTAQARRDARTAALAAIAGAVDGDLAVIRGAGPFVFVGAASIASDGVMAINSTGSPAGRWVSTLFVHMAAANGLATLDANKRVAQSYPGSTVGAAGASSSSADGTTSTAFVDAAGLALSLPQCQAGDLVAIDFALTSGDASAASGYSRIVVAEARSTSFAVVADSSRFFASLGAHRSGHHLYRVGSAGTIAIKVQIRSAGGGLFPLDGSSARTLRGIVMRP
jgi:hypothetical protein